MNWQLVGIVGVVAVVAGGVLYLIWRSKWLWGKAESLGESDQRAREAEGARGAEEEARAGEREISEILIERRDTSDTRKRLKDASF